MLDFTLKTYKRLLTALKHHGYNFIRFDDYISNSSLVTRHSSLIILRHDVDRLPENSLQTAIIEHKLGIKGTYYFRIVPESYDLAIMEKIAKLGHEIGYHYEDVDLIVTRDKVTRDKFSLRVTRHSLRNIDDLIDRAYLSFCKNLEMLRRNFDIKTICMHGSPRSPFDNRLIWSKYDYHTLRIIGEPYLDIDFNRVLYLTDTGRRWDGENVNIRDKVGKRLWSLEKNKEVIKVYKFRSTYDIIKAAGEHKLPEQLMITFHPQRWTNKLLPWVSELFLQNAKNVCKYILIKIN